MRTGVPPAKSSRGHRRQSSWGQGSALTPLPQDQPHPPSPLPQPAIGTSHTRPHPVSVQNDTHPLHTQPTSLFHSRLHHLTLHAPWPVNTWYLVDTKGAQTPLHTVVHLIDPGIRGLSANTPHTWLAQAGHTLPMPSNQVASTHPHSPAGPGLPLPTGPSGKAPGKGGSYLVLLHLTSSPSTHLLAPFPRLPRPHQMFGTVQGGCAAGSPGQTAMPGSPG